jgi:hypothetical protein
MAPVFLWQETERKATLNFPKASKSRRRAMMAENFHATLDAVQ